jgi:hypothetical protein
VTAKLAIFAPQLGTASETFIRRHVEDLLPGRTVVVARNSKTVFDGYWRPQCPVLFMDAPTSRSVNTDVIHEYD